jgi:hypothetical protein
MRQALCLGIFVALVIDMLKLETQEDGAMGKDSTFKPRRKSARAVELTQLKSQSGLAMSNWQPASKYRQMREIKNTRIQNTYFQLGARHILDAVSLTRAI